MRKLISPIIFHAIAALLCSVLIFNGQLSRPIDVNVHDTYYVFSFSSISAYCWLFFILIYYLLKLLSKLNKVIFYPAITGFVLIILLITFLFYPMLFSEGNISIKLGTTLILAYPIIILANQVIQFQKLNRNIS